MTVAFDFDGTLVTAGPRQALCLRAVARRYNVHLDPADVWTAKREGRSNAAILSDMGLGQALAARIAAEWRDIIETPYWLSLDVVFDDVLTVLQSFTARGEDCFLITARQHDRWLRQQVDRLHLSGYFTGIHCVSPQDAVQQKAALLERIRPRAFFGDSESDYQAAQKAGSVFAAVSTGQRSARFLKARGIDRVSETLTGALAAMTIDYGSGPVPGEKD